MTEIPITFEQDTVSARIKRLRKDTGLSQIDFLEKYGSKIQAGRSTLSQWENGGALPDVWQLLELCRIFDCDPGYILGEYDCKRRISTDIQNEIGLSEDAIELLRIYNGDPGLKHIIDFLDFLILDTDNDNMNNLSHIASASCAYSVEVNNPRFKKESIDEEIIKGGIIATCQNRFMQFLERYARNGGIPNATKEH